MAHSPALFQSFRDDHRRVLAHMDTLEREVLGRLRAGRLPARAQGSLRETVGLLEAQFATHMAAEETLLYPAIADVMPEARVSLHPLQVEHGELRSMLARLDELTLQPTGAARDEQIVVTVRDLVDLLRIHIHKEEAAVFNVAVRVLAPREIESLADRVAAHHARQEATRPRARMRRPGMKGTHR